MIMFLLLWLLTWSGVSRSDSAQTTFVLEEHSNSTITFVGTWHSLGPFRIGTREAIWGSDPLEAIGGFPGIPHDDECSFRSPLAPNATVSWTTHDVNAVHTDTEATVNLDVGYDHIDWNFQQQVYGWSALQYQAWIRGKLYNHDNKVRKAWLYPESILEFSLNGKRFFGGDVFSFNRAPVLVDLQPGRNVLDIRLIRDVRAMGALNPPRIQAKVCVRLASDLLELDQNLSIAPELVDGKLPSHYFSVVVRNPSDEWISVVNCKDYNLTSHFDLLSSTRITIAPGQTRPIALRSSLRPENTSTITDGLCYWVHTFGNFEFPRLNFTFDLRPNNISEPGKFTFLHPSGVVSYAILKPPTVTCKESTVPLLVLLHGANLEADSELVRHSLDAMTELETIAIFPTGMSPWSGDDWHLWGAADVLNAIEAVNDWMTEMSWNGSQVTTQRVIMVGHSNGGQGAWYFATHHPDRTIAAAPLSAYSSIENYVTYNMWMESEPVQASVLATARLNYRHELLIGNLAGIPTLQQHGTLDDNVPTYHSRLMSSLRAEIDLPSDYVEIPDKPHWWDEAPTSEPLRQFYRQYSKQEQKDFEAGNFSIVVPGCGDVESKNGIIIDQLRSPDHLGRVEVEVQTYATGSTWRLTTTNIRRIHFNFTNCPVRPPTRIVLDWHFEYNHLHANMTASEVSCVNRYGTWDCADYEWKHVGLRYGRQRGSLEAIMRSDANFKIVADDSHDLDLAMQTSRNLFQYYGADSEFMLNGKYAKAIESPGNVILLVSGKDPPDSQLANYPIEFFRRDIKLTVRGGGICHIHMRPGLGALFLRPLHDEKLELVVWGSDRDALFQAARLIPTLTGAGQPDFVIFDGRIKSKGHAGVISMGFFNYDWEISDASYVPIKCV